MEITYSTSNFSWMHEITPGKRLVPPKAEELVPVLDDQGMPVINPNTQEPVMRPIDGWQPTLEDIELDTIVFYEAKPETDQVTVFKFAADKDSLARIFAHFVPFLDAEGRLQLYNALKSTSDLVLPETKLELITGGNREQRRRKQ